MSMRIIKWENLKRRAVEVFINTVDVQNPFSDVAFLALMAGSLAPAGQCRKPADVMNEWLEFGIRLIENWDIRQCMKLVDLFPGCLPKHLQNKGLQLFYTSLWIILLFLLNH